MPVMSRREAAGCSIVATPARVPVKEDQKCLSMPYGYGRESRSSIKWTGEKVLYRACSVPES